MSNNGKNSNDLKLRIEKMEPEYKTLVETERSIRDVLDEVKKDRRSAEREFSKNESEIRRLTSTVINVFSYDFESRIRDAVSTASEAGRRLNSACQRLVDRLDAKCDMLYNPAVDPKLAKEIAEELHELNETSVINIDFSGAFEGVSFGHVGDIDYGPSRDALRIEARWEVIASEAEKKGGIKILLTKYDISESEWSDYTKYQKTVDEFQNVKTTAELSKIKSAFLSLGDFMDAQLYVEMCDEKQPQLKAVEDKQKADEAKRIAAKKAEEAKKQQEKIAKANEKKTAAAAKLERKIKELDNSISDAEKRVEKENNAAEKRKSELESELETLGFFSFVRKSSLKKEIKAIVLGIKKRKDELEEFKMEQEAEQSKLREALEIINGKTGDEVIFGHQFYSKGTMPMSWLIVGCTDGVVKLVSKHTVATKRPFELDVSDPWNKNSFWLSQIYYEQVFSPKERLILDTGINKIGLPTKEDLAKLGDAIRATPEPAFDNANVPYYDSWKASHYWVGGFNYHSSFISNVYYVDPMGEIKLNAGNSFYPYGVRPVINIDMKKLSDGYLSGD